LSRSLNVGSALLFIVGILAIVYGLQRMLLPSLPNLFLPALSIDEEFLGVTISQIRDFSPRLMVVIQNLIQIVGLYLLTTAISACFISLLPYRRGEKWAWYAMLVLGGTIIVGGQYLFITTYSVIGILDMVLVILLIIGLGLPAREILKKG
jgi:hypothetical protein